MREELGILGECGSDADVLGVSRFDEMSLLARVVERSGADTVVANAALTTGRPFAGI